MKSTSHLSKLHLTNPDIAATISRKYYKLAIVCLLWTAAVSIAEILYMYEYFVAKINVFSSIIIWILLCTVPFFIMKGHKLVFDKSWEGKIIHLNYTKVVKNLKHSVSSSRTSPPFSSRRIAYVDILEILVDCGEKAKIVTLYCPKPEEIFPFKVGDTICHYKGTNYPVFGIESESGEQFCPICGTVNHPGARECFYCDHSIIKPSKRKDSAT